MGLDFGLDIVFRRKEDGYEESYNFCYARKCYSLRDFIREKQSKFWVPAYKEKECENDYIITSTVDCLPKLIKAITKHLINIHDENSIWEMPTLNTIYIGWIYRLSLLNSLIEMREENCDEIDWSDINLNEWLAETLDTPIENSDISWDEYSKLDSKNQSELREEVQTKLKERFIYLFENPDYEVLIRTYNSY